MGFSPILNKRQKISFKNSISIFCFWNIYTYFRQPTPPFTSTRNIMCDNSYFHCNKQACLQQWYLVKCALVQKHSSKRNIVLNILSLWYCVNQTDYICRRDGPKTENWTKRITSSRLNGKQILFLRNSKGKHMCLVRPETKSENSCTITEWWLLSLDWNHWGPTSLSNVEVLFQC